MKQNNVINLSDYREEKEEEHRKSLPPQYIQDFEVGGYYVYPELGVMIHCMLITDISHTRNNELMYIMEDQFGNLLSVPISDPDSMMGWQAIDEEIFVETIKNNLPEPEFEPEPPRAS